MTRIITRDKHSDPAVRRGEEEEERWRAEGKETRGWEGEWRGGEEKNERMKRKRGRKEGKGEGRRYD